MVNSMDSKLYLNLGCYNKPFPKPFVNVDVRPYPETMCDVCDDVRTLNEFKDNSVDLIFNSHLFEHLNKEDRIQALKTWYRVLKPGGILRISVPDFEAIAAHYFYWKDLKYLQAMIHGSQKHPFDFHYYSYDFATLAKLLEENGFCNVRAYNFSKEWPHNYIDDYSQSFYPDYAKKMTMANGKDIDLGGKLLSLNIMADKLCR